MSPSNDLEPDLTDLDLQSLRVVKAISERGSITAAAAALGFSQPAVSQQLKRLESRIGMPVVERVGRGVRLTEAGRILARHALTVSTALNVASGELGEARGLKSGRVRLAAFPTASSTIVTQLLRQFAEKHHGIQVNFIESEPPESLVSIRNGTTDIAITFGYPGDSSEPLHDRERAAGFETFSLCQDEMLVALPADHPAAAGDAVDLHDIAHERWIAGCPLCRGHLLSVCQASGFVPAIGYETDNFVAVLSMVAAGLGVALVPKLFLAASPLPAGVVIRSTSPQTYRTLNVVFTSGSDRIPTNSLALRMIAGLDFSQWSLEPVAGGLWQPGRA